MLFFYNISLLFYLLMIRIASLFNDKARLWIGGRRALLARLKSEVDNNHPIAWFHCASLGEFEQGRPLIEAFKLKYPTCKILLTFFSPSGYEVRKNYAGADIICYLPMDTPGNAQKFLDIVQPKIAVFVKYEYWFNYINGLSKRNIPLIYVSAIFRPGQRFFTRWGRWQLDILKKASHFFVQNEESSQLLQDAGIRQVTVSGDTRFDRVYEVAQEKKAFPVIEQFKGKAPLLLAGSTWPADEEIIVPLIEDNPLKMKFIFAPHEVHPERIQLLERKLPGKVVRFSQIDAQSAHDADVLIIDSIGILSHLYQYASIAYIGGGFGVGIHNILEAATFGNPVIFGPNYRKFQEANELIAKGGAFTINSQKEFEDIIKKLLKRKPFYQQSSDTSKNYVESKQGATDAIMGYISGKLL